MCFISNAKDSNLKSLRKHTPLADKRNLSTCKMRHTFGNWNDNMHLTVHRQTVVALSASLEQLRGLEEKNEESKLAEEGQLKTDISFLHSWKGSCNKNSVTILSLASIVILSS